MKRQLIAAALAALPLCASAGNEEAAAQYFTSSAPRLTAQEKSALTIVAKARSASAGMRALAGTDGMVRFVAGVHQIQIVCAVLQVCDIELQAGEQIRNLNVGDPRFSVELATSGAGASEVQHLIIKPHDVGLSSSLVVSTDRRTYHMKLRSHRTDYMPRVGFIYPDEVQAKALAVQQREAAQRADDTMQSGESIHKLNFDYTVTGTASWKPVRVYNDGMRTVIQMPASVKQTEAPVLLVLRRDGRPFRGDEQVQVNYRLHDDRFIVDTVVNKAILIAGVGSSQDRVTITRGN